MGTNVITNGSFKCQDVLGNLQIPNWDPHYLTTGTANPGFEELASGGIEITPIDEEREYPYENSKAPGLYQKINLTNYSSTVQLDINIKAARAFVYDSEDQPPLDFCLYIYECDKDGVQTGNYDDYVIKEKYTVNGHFDQTSSIQLSPRKYYLIGIGCDYTVYKVERVNSSYYCKIKDSIAGLQLFNIEALATESKELHIPDLIQYERYSITSKVRNAWYDYGTTYECPEKITIRMDKNDSPVITEYADYTLGAYFSSNTTFDEAVYNQYGICYTFEVPVISDSVETINEYSAYLRFWYRSDLPIGSKFKVILVDAIGQEYIEETVVINSNQWTLYTKYLSTVFDEKYKLVFVPPAESFGSYDAVLDQNRGLLIGSNLTFTIFTPAYSKDGSFDDPYTDREGNIFWDCGLDENGDYYANPQFRFYKNNNRKIKKNSFIRINGKYYMTKDDNGNLCSDGLFKFIDDSGNEYFRYFEESAIMKFNDDFIYEGKHYTIDKNGIATFYSVMEKLELRIEGYENTAKVIDGKEGDTFNLVATFNKMYPPVTLDVEYDNYVMNVLDMQTREEIDELGAYNTTYNITILCKSYCIGSPLTFSYTNRDGSVISETVSVYIGFESGEIEYTVLELPYSENYITPDSELQLKCLAKPLMSFDVPVDWTSPDWFIQVDSMGNVRGLVPGLSGTVTAINYRSGSTASCTIHIVEKLEEATSIQIGNSSTHQIVNGTKIDAYIGDVISLHSLVYSSKVPGLLGSTENVRQDVRWSSSDEWIASVNDFGYVKATGSGTTTITCCTYNNRYVNASVTINVLGESVPLEYIELDTSQSELTFIKGDRVCYEDIKPILYPANTTQPDLVWYSYTPDVIKVDQNGRVSDAGTIGTSIIRCASLAKSSIYAQCIVSVVDAKDYVPKVFYSKESNIITSTGKTVQIGYRTTNSPYVTTNIRCKMTKQDGSATTNSAAVYDDYIEITCPETGNFVLTTTCEYTVFDPNSNLKFYKGSFDETFNINVKFQDLPPEFVKNLVAENVYYNGSYVLNYYIKDDIDPDSDFTHILYIDNVPKVISQQLLLCDGSDSHYIFGQNLGEGSHEIYVEAFDLNNQYIKSDTITVTVPKINSHKSALEDSKRVYDVHINNILDLLHELIEDQYVVLDEKKEFDTKYKKFDYAYENLRYILNLCVNQINSQIGESQAQMATLASALASDGTSIVAYSEGDYTNSNYENVSDLDYYQNECIKGLVNRVLQLEALVQKLMNNND